MTPDLTIIIVNWNTRRLLRDCLASLPEACGGLQVQTVVVDNASADGSADLVRREFPTCRLVEGGANLGFSRANNLALATAESDLILLLNPDTVCPPDSLARLCAYLASHPDAAAAGPTLMDATGRPVASWGDFPALRHHLLSLIDPARSWLPRRWRQLGLGTVPWPEARSAEVDYVKGACLLLRRNVLAEIGPLDERFFMYFEETDWCRRALHQGYPTHHCAEVRITHLEGQAAARAGSFAQVQFQSSYRLYLAKHHGPGSVWAFRTAQFLEYSWKGLLRLLAPGDRQQNRAQARDHFGVARLQLKQNLQPTPPA